MKYDPNYWFERESFIEKCRSFLVEEDFSDEWKELMNEIITLYEKVNDLFRSYEDCFDQKKKDKLWKQFTAASDELTECFNIIERELNAL